MDKPCILSYEYLDHGYPKRWIGGKRVRLNRIVLEQKLGRPIREGYEACHSCNVTNCIEPEHIYEGTHTDNMWDVKKAGKTRFFGNYNKEKTHCKRGHEFTPENTRKSRGSRCCRICDNSWRARNKERNKVVAI